jgi:hypothetical protein
VTTVPERALDNRLTPWRRIPRPSSCCSACAR